MSKFIEFRFPCIDCLVAAACKEGKQVTKKDLINQSDPLCLALPTYDYQTTSYTKILIECLAELSFRVASKLNEDRESKIPAGYRHFLIEYMRIFAYISNSSSWRGEIDPVAPFDKNEIKRRVKKLSSFLDWKE